MEVVLYIVGSLSVTVCLLLNVLATVAIRYDKSLEPFQVKAQTVFIWLVPFLGAGFVLHLVWQQYPDAIPKAWIPWPFKKMIYGKNPPRNRNRDDCGGIDGGGEGSARGRPGSQHGNSDGDGGGGD